MRPTADLPDDPRLPGLMAIRDRGLARAIPALGLEQGGGGVELVLCGYHPGARATLDARVGQRRFAVKTFADDPAPEAALYQALGAAGLAGDSGARVPPLLAWDHDLRVLVRSEEHTSELQSLAYLVCRLLLEKKKTTMKQRSTRRISRSYP